MGGPPPCVTPSTGGPRRDSLPFSETGSLGDDNTSPVVEFFREETKEEPPARSWLGGLGAYFKPTRAPPQTEAPRPPPPPVDGYEDDSPPSRHDTPPLLMRHAPKAALDVQLSMRSTALAQALDNDEDDESTASEASSATAEPVDSGEEAVLAAMSPVKRLETMPLKRPASPFAAVAPIASPAAILERALPNPPTPPRRPVARRTPVVIPQPRPTAWVTGDGHMTYARPVPRRFELNAAALPAVGDAGEDADALYSPTAPLPRPTAWVTGGGALTYQSPRRRSEPLRPSELPAVGAAGEDAATLYSPAAAVPRARLAQTATATLFHLPAGPEAPPAVVRVSDMGPTLEQSATSMLLSIPAAVRRPPAEPLESRSLAVADAVRPPKPQPRPTAWTVGDGAPSFVGDALPPGTGVRVAAPPAPPSPRPTAWVVGAGTAARVGDALPPGRGLFQSPAAPKARKRVAAPPAPKPTAWVVGRGTTALVGDALPPGSGVVVDDHAAAKTFLRAQISKYEASQQKTPASPTEPVGAPELPPTPVTDSPARDVEAEAPDASEAARIVAAPSVSPRRDWAKKRWNPASPTKQNAPVTPPSGARQWAQRRWNPTTADTPADTPAEETTSPPSGSRKWAQNRWNPATTPSFSEAGDTPQRRRRWSTPPQKSSELITPKRRSSSIKPSDAISAKIASLQQDATPNHVEKESIDEVKATPTIKSRMAMLREASQVQKSTIEDTGLGVKWRRESLVASMEKTAAPLIDAKSELRGVATDGPSQLLRQRSQQLEVQSIRAAYDERRRPSRRRAARLDGAAVFTSPGPVSPPKQESPSYVEISEGTVSSLSQNYNDLIARTLREAREARERLAGDDDDAARRRRVQAREAERIRKKAELLRNACAQPMILNTASNPWALRVDATCPTPGATLHVSLDGGKHWHTKHAVDSNTATLSLDVDDNEERVVLAYATKTGNAPSDVASMAFSREPPRYILHEAHASELCLRGHTTTGKRCIVCGLEANDADDYTDDNVVVCKKCALAPLAARFGGVQAGLYEGEADPTKAACCVAVDAAAHRLWLSGPVHFEGNRDVIVDASFTLLDQLASVLKKHPSIAIRLEGHTNSKCGLQCDGSYVCANNRCAKDFGGSGGASAFSRRRAEAVARYLEGAGVSSERVHAAGLAGSRRLVDDTEGPLKHLNRRVEVHTVAF